MNFLILQRKQGESLIINDTTKVTFIRESKGFAKFVINRNGNTNTVIVPLGQTSSIGIGGHIVVTKRFMQARKVKLAFDIPAGVKIWREEVYKKMNGGAH